MECIEEGAARIAVRTQRIPTRDMPVFYNAAMAFNRDFSVALLRACARRHMVVADPLAGSGIRAIRFLRELPRGAIRSIYVNDRSAMAVRSIQKNLVRNGCAGRKVHVSCRDARDMLRERQYDYIDIDPFGYPGPFMDAALLHLAPRGILAVTATDTAALCGSAPRATLRKYHAANVRSHMMHEMGLRILIGYAVREARARGVRLQVLASYTREHYMRAFFRRVPRAPAGKRGMLWLCTSCHAFGAGKRARCRACAQAATLLGPLWLGRIGSSQLVARIAKKCGATEQKFMRALVADTKSDAFGLYDIHELCSQMKIGAVPRIDCIISRLVRAGKKASRPHTNPHAVKTDSGRKLLLRAIRMCAARR